MDLNEMLSRFKKYGAIGQAVSFGFFFAIFSLAYPVLQDTDLFCTALSFSIAAFAFLYIYYVYWMNSRIVKYVVKPAEPGSAEKLILNLNRAAGRIFYIQMAGLVCLYAPLMLIMYRYLGYDNLYYHFYVLFISFFIILYLGYFTKKTSAGIF